MKEWKDGFDGADWPDDGKRVELEFADGSLVKGKLNIEDFFPLDDGDEVPVFVVNGDDGNKYSYFDAKRWRFISAESLSMPSDNPPPAG